MKTKNNTVLILLGLTAVVGAAVVYNREKDKKISEQVADKAKNDMTVDCGMLLMEDSGLLNVDVLIESYASNPACMGMLVEYVNKYHPAHYQELVSSGTMTQDQAGARLEIDKQKALMAKNSMSGLGWWV